MRDFRSRKAWSAYHAEKKKGFPYSGTACLKLDDGYRHSFQDRPGATSFAPYWLALELIKEGKGESLKISTNELLARCRKNYEEEKRYRAQFKPVPETYKGNALIWEPFRPYDERFNDPGYGHETQVCTLPFRATKEDKEALYELIYTPFVDPYCDGRGCTGAMFTGSIQMYTTVNKTVILHYIKYDV